MNPTLGITFLFFCLNCLLFTSSGQPALKDAEQVYQYWVQRGIIEVAYSYMKDYSNDNSINPQEKTGIINFEEKFIKNINENSLSEIDKSYKKIYGFLNENGWKLTANKIVNPLIDKFNNRLVLDSTFFSVIEKPGNNYLKTVANILEEYETSLNMYKSRSLGDKASNSEQPLAEESSQVKKKTFGYSWIFFGITLGYLLGAIVVYYYVNGRIRKILKEERNHYINILKEKRKYNVVWGFIGIVEILKQHKDDYKNPSEKPEIITQLNNQKNENDNLKQQISELRKINDSLSYDLKTVKEVKNSKNVEVLKNEGSEYKKILFYSIPEPDGMFKVDGASEHKEQDSFYKLEFINANEGTIYFISGDYDLRAIENIDYYINPACEVQNIGNRIFARKVQMINPGSFIRNGNSWQIQNKIKINLV